MTQQPHLDCRRQVSNYRRNALLVLRTSLSAYHGTPLVFEAPIESTVLMPSGDLLAAYTEHPRPERRQSVVPRG